MIFKPYYLGCLAHASYLIGDEVAKAAVVVDPQRDVAPYLEDARQLGLHIGHVFFTRFHADGAAGPIALRDRGARIHLGAQAMAPYEFSPLHDGDTFDLGDVRLQVLETPGHRPDEITLLVFDRTRNPDRPHAVLTADRHFLGDVGAFDFRPLSLEEVLRQARAGAQVLDVREAADFAAVHLAGSLNIGLGGPFASWAGVLLDRARPIVIVADPGREHEAALRLGRIGFDHVTGFLEGGARAVQEHPELTGRLQRLTAAELRRRLAAPQPPVVVDVRSVQERLARRIEGSVHFPLSQLCVLAFQLPRHCPLVVHCGSGYCSATAASLLARLDFTQVFDLVGGIAAWAQETSEAPKAA